MFFDKTTLAALIGCAAAGTTDFLGAKLEPRHKAGFSRHLLTFDTLTATPLISSFTPVGVVENLQFNGFDLGELALTDVAGLGLKERGLPVVGGVTGSLPVVGSGTGTGSIIPSDVPIVGSGTGTGSIIPSDVPIVGSGSGTGSIIPSVIPVVVGGSGGTPILPIPTNVPIVGGGGTTLPSGGGVIGVQPNSGSNVIVHTTVGSGAQKSASITISPAIKSFGIKSFYFGCTATSGLTLATAATPCTISVTGFKKGQAKAYDSLSYSFSAKTPLDQPMKKAILPLRFNELHKVEFAVTSTTTTDANTALLIDTIDSSQCTTH